MYFLSGYVLTLPPAAGGFVSREKNGKTACLYFILGIVFLLVSCSFPWIIKYRDGGNYLPLMRFTERSAPFICLTVWSFFLAVWKMPISFPSKVGNFLKQFGKGSFAVFLYHLPWLMFVETRCYWFPIWLLVPIYLIGGLITGFLPYLLLRHVPLLKKLVV